MLHGIVLACLIASMFVTGTSAHAGTMKLGEIVRFKGQETNTLQGLGLVVGLRGTGDADALPTSRALARMMQLMGGPMAMNATGGLDLNDVAEAKNVAMVFVTATIPNVGAQSGDQLDVQVHAINAKSLEGGTLMLTPLLGPRADNPSVYAMARGQISISRDGQATSGVIKNGAKMEASVRASYAKDNKLTLVIRPDFASFDTAQRIEDEINNLNAMTLGSTRFSGASSSDVARAIDQLHIEVTIPEVYRESPIKLIWFLERIPIQMSSHPNRVVINEREGVVVIGKDVEIAPVLITHRNMRIEAGGSGFVPINEELDDDGGIKLKALADALNALEVPTEDLIAIIKSLQRKGDLFGEVIFQ
ncbi:MAG: flagellar basal body P-ring protein FlgI [Planctomycetota bacterium]